MFFGRKTVGESCFEVLANLSTPSVIFGSRREIFRNLRKLSEIFGQRRQIFGIPSFRLRGDVKSHAFYFKKLEGIGQVTSFHQIVTPF